MVDQELDRRIVIRARGSQDIRNIPVADFPHTGQPRGAFRAEQRFETGNPFEASFANGARGDPRAADEAVWREEYLGREFYGGIDVFHAIIMMNSFAP